MDIIIKNSRVLGFSGQNNITIENNKISQISKNANIPSPEYVIEGEHLFTIPSLINSHTHTPMTLLRGYSDNLTLFPWLQKIWSIEKFIGPEETQIGAELAFLEMIKSGTGCFMDFYFNQDKIIPAAKRSGLRGYLGAGIIEGAFLEQGGSKWLFNVADRVCSELNNDPLLTGVVAPHAPHTCSEETLHKSLEMADKYKSIITIHLSETRDDVLTIQKSKGVPPIEWLDKEFNFFSNRKVIAAHCVWIQQREIEILARNNSAMAFCPVSGQKLAYGGMAPVPELLSANVPVCLGTDGPASNNTLDMVREMRNGATMISHMRWDPSIVNAQQILEMATTNFRNWIYGKNYSLKQDSTADLTIFDFKEPHCIPVYSDISTAVYSANGSDVSSLIVDGKMLLHEKNVLTLNEEEVISKAKKTSQDLLLKASSDK